MLFIYQKNLLLTSSMACHPVFLSLIISKKKQTENLCKFPPESCFRFKNNVWNTYYFNVTDFCLVYWSIRLLWNHAKDKL